MKILFENIKRDSATRIVEYNGKKFRMHLEYTHSMPMAIKGHDWYHSLSILTDNGTFSQITDAEEVGSSVSHYRCIVERDFPKLCEDFENYIKAVY